MLWLATFACAVVSAPFSLPIIAGATLIGAGIAAVAARSDTLIKNKVFRAIAGGITALGCALTFKVAAPIALIIGLVASYLSPKVSFSKIAAEKVATNVADSIDGNKIKLDGLKDLYKVIPMDQVAPVAKEIINKLGVGYLSGVATKVAKEELKKQQTALKELIDKNSSIRIVDILSIVLPKNDGTIEKQFAEAKPYFIAKDKEQIVKEGKINTLKNLYVDNNTQQIKKGTYLDDAKEAGKVIKVLSDNEKAVNNSGGLKKAIQTIGVTQL